MERDNMLASILVVLLKLGNNLDKEKILIQNTMTIVNLHWNWFSSLLFQSDKSQRYQLCVKRENSINFNVPLGQQ